MSCRTQCVADRRPGRASASTSSTSLRSCGPRRRNFRRFPTRGPALPRTIRAEDRGKLKSRSDLELIVVTVLRPLVIAPSQKGRRMAEAVALHVVVLHFADSLDAQRLPREVLAGTPPAVPTWHALPGWGSGRRSFTEVGPLAPWVRIQRVLAKRLQFLHQLPSLFHGERRSHADVMKRALIVEQSEQQRSDDVRRLLVPAESAHHTVGRSRML